MAKEVSDAAWSSPMSLTIEEGGTYDEALRRFSRQRRQSAALESNALVDLLRHNQLAAEFAELRSFVDKTYALTEGLGRDITKDAERWGVLDARLSRAEENRRTYSAGRVVFFVVLLLAASISVAALTSLGYQYFGAPALRDLVWRQDDLVSRKEMEAALSQGVTHEQLKELDTAINAASESQERRMEIVTQQLGKVVSQAREASDLSKAAKKTATEGLSLAAKRFQEIEQKLGERNAKKPKN